MVTSVATIAVFPEEKLTQSQKVEKWVWQLCRSLEENYKLRYPDSSEPIKFRMEFGRKYIKIIQQNYDTFRDINEYRDGGVHAFVNKKTGEVYKAASWKSPAKHVRYDLRVINEREYVLDPNNCGWAGGYLYMK